jgi:hypothetical protein
MAKNILYIRLTANQLKELNTQIEQSGFDKKSDYIRNILFNNNTLNKKIYCMSRIRTT